MLAKRFIEKKFMKMKKELKTKIKSDVNNFINSYQNALWNIKMPYLKSEQIIELITLFDIYKYYNWDCSFKEFKVLVDQDDNFNETINDFLSNNFIHYSSSVKHKEFLQEYKESLIHIEPPSFKIDLENMGLLASIQKRACKTSFGLNLNDGSELDDQEQNELLKHVETF